MSLTLQSVSKNINTEIRLTGSKSESNRALIIQNLCDEGFPIHNLSEAKDTVTLKNILGNTTTVADVGPAGTAMRFLTARFAIAEGTVLLTGTERMKQRPIGILVDALRKLGADIEYTGIEGFPPLQITGKSLPGGSISIDGSVSSQFISALCLIAPKMENGLQLQFEGEIASRPYLDMTLEMQRSFGIEHSWNDNTLSIPNQHYQPADFTVEPDWSAASYWYAVAALADTAEIFLPNLKKHSLQGDAVLPVIFERFGVETEFQNGGIQLSKTTSHQLPEIIEIDCEKCPDLAQTFATTIAGLGIGGRLSGLKSLRIKETDRITALITELAKFGITARELPDFVLEINPGKLHQPSGILATYEDHRMAMAFAPLILKVDTLTFDDPEVVEKSYPEFWEHLEVIAKSV
ncbi:MAG: 3-phosphoshikimate 1-carboxyvinyltransferase [Bacteroidota bacterium]